MGGGFSIFDFGFSILDFGFVSAGFPRRRVPASPNPLVNQIRVLIHRIYWEGSKSTCCAEILKPEAWIAESRRRIKNHDESGAIALEDRRYTPMNPDDVDAALFAAAHDGDMDAAVAAVAAGANVNASNPYRVTPLLEACGMKHLEVARLLVENRADIDYTGMPEGSPLMLAAFMGLLDFLRLFIESGANVNLAMPDGKETALHMAAVTGNTGAARVLLESGADPNLRVASGASTSMFDAGARMWGETPLHYAAAYGDEKMIQAMLRAGADPHARNAHGETPLNYAGRHRRPRGIRDLLK